MGKYKPVQLKSDQHKRLRLIAAMRGLSMAEVIYRGLDLFESQTELPHPTDGTPVPVVYQQKQEGK